jgi:hypothetical protein
MRACGFDSARRRRLGALEVCPTKETQMPLTLIWSFITGPIGRWLVVAVAVAGLCAGSFYRGYQVAEGIELGKQNKQRIAYEADVAKKSALINDLNLAYAKNELAHQEKETALVDKFTADLTAAGKKPIICSDSKNLTDDLNAIIGAGK